MKTQRFLALVILISICNSALLAQDYTISKKTQRINDTKYEGFSISVKGSFAKVTEQIYSYLKGKSKIRRKRNYYSIAEFNLEKITLDSTIIYVRIDEKETASLVWMGIKPRALEEDRIIEIEDALQEELVLMARSYYVHEQEIKIKQAETAAQIISKKQQKLINENISLTKDLQEAEERKIELDNFLEENKLSIVVLKQKLINNKFNQDSTYIDLQKINRVIKNQKQKLKEID